MSQGDTEEKSLPASARKLRDARRKGQIPHSRDTVIATVTAAAFLYLWLRWPALIGRLEQMFEVTARAGMRPLDEALAIAPAILELAGGIVLPLILVVIAISVVTNLALTRGLVFAIDPIVPRPEKINPAAGFKRIFSLKNLVELVKSVVKVVLLAALLTGIALLSLEALFTAPRCGARCLASVFGAMAGPVIIAAAGVFLLSALFDIALQRWLFLREMRMSRSELKRERKDEEGDPHIRSARRRRQRGAGQDDLPTGVRHATLMVRGRGDAAIGLRFVRGETPVPVIVCRGQGDGGKTLLAAAQARGIPVVDDADLVRSLLDFGTRPGNYVPQDLFNQIAAILVRAGAV
ncbi:MAG TPA: EscU/YscU/HrcU family type III secretion system export apparatus switch protein [Alphaproteobacteria bacterium]|nr:EscU/YscU/HrcU family type III secretion system export apparatus switch protein [Alphaproteobacteria bacterium]